MKKIVRTDKAPNPVGPYNQAVVAGNLVFTAGQVAIDPRTNEVLAGGIEEQTRLVLKNLQAILHAAGSDLGKVLKTTVFLKNMNDFPAMNAVYAEFFPENPPARSTVEVGRLPKDVLVEIECIAVL
ncbi:MAG: RidA family protein [Calditrichaceae bacterium]|nr:RidA family protein [Calditrichia bacterium]NUQ41438.1 RidA family protein [Calditrichaceae bacterium]